MTLARPLAATLFAFALAGAPGSAAAIAGVQPSIPPAESPVWVVTSQRSFEGVSGYALEAHPWSDRRGEALVVAELDDAGMAALARHVHEVERRCGGFFAFATRQEAEAFIAGSRSAEAIALPMGGLYTIDNQATVEPWLGQVSEANLYGTMATLSAFHDRHYRTSDGRSAALWIRDAWQAIVAGRGDIDVELYEACSNCSTQPSVILTIHGTELADEVVVIGGHLDSINWRDWPTDNPTLRAPGADDDASGIATMTEMIRIALASGWQPKRTVKFMGYAAEETGLRGSRAIAGAYEAEGINVVGVLQLDMTNYRSGGVAYDLRIVTDNSNSALVTYLGELFDAYLAPRGLSRGAMECGYGCSDHAAWTESGYPAAMLFEAGRPPSYPGDMADFPYIHTANDTLANMGETAAPTIPFAQLGLAFLGELGKTHGPLPPNEAPVADFGWSVDGRRVTFSDTSTDADGTLVAWHWDFGDGTSSTARNPQKLYQADGRYEVSLTVTDDGGLTDERTQTVATDDAIFVDGFDS